MISFNPYWQVAGLILFLVIVALLIRSYRAGEPPSERDDLLRYEQARQAYIQAERNFEQADSEHVDIAVYQMQAAELEMGNEVRRLRE